MAAETYDFIVVGAGAAGCACATRLSQSPGAPSVLLLEAGGVNDDMSKRMLAERCANIMNPDLDWAYTSEPQDQLAGQTMLVSRGKGLGGGTALNFAAFTKGPRHDYDRWAELVDDDAFAWDNAQRVYGRIESFDDAVPSGYEASIGNRPRPSTSTRGPVFTSHRRSVEPDFNCLYEAAKASGIPINMDANSGDPIGLGLCANSARGSVRSTAKEYLDTAPANLKVLSSVLIDRIIIERGRAVGVDAAGTQYLAKNDVIVSAGAINSPKLLLLSGVGPKAQLESLGIACKLDLPAVGQNLQDHPLVMLQFRRREGTSSRSAFFSDAARVARAREKWAKDPFAYIGELATIMNCLPMAFLRDSSVMETQQFASLPVSEREHLKASTVPTWEWAAGLPPIPLPSGALLEPHQDYMCCAVFLQAAQSTGSVQLKSADPRDLPRVDVGILTHPFDVVSFVRAVRSFLQFMRHPLIAKDTVEILNGPASQSDNDIWDFIKQHVGTSWHHSCTVKMGRAGDESACLDSDFRVKGLDGLLVVDTSALPFVPNAHTQAVAYLCGEIAAEKIVSRYAL